MSKTQRPYMDYTNLRLITIIDSPFDYTEKGIQKAWDELRHRDLPTSQQKAIAKVVMQEKIEQMFNGFSPIHNKLTIPKSAFLDQHEVLDMLKEAYTEWKEKREDMGLDVWSYAIGGI